METRIRIKSNISLIKLDAEYESAIPGDEYFELEDEFVDEYTARYIDIGDFAEISYCESENEHITRVLSYDKKERVLTIRREFGNTCADIKVGSGVIYKNQYYVEGVGEMPMETYGKVIEWDGDIYFEYLTYLGEIWSKIQLRIEFLGEGIV